MLKQEIGKLKIEKNVQIHPAVLLLHRAVHGEGEKVPLRRCGPQPLSAGHPPLHLHQHFQHGHRVSRAARHPYKGQLIVITKLMCIAHTESVI